MSRSAVAIAAAVSAVTVAALTACTGRSDDPAKPTGPETGPNTPAAYRLVSFPDCNAALDGLRTAARNNLLAWGARRLGVDDFRAQGGAADSAAGGAPFAAPDAAGAREADSSGKQAGSDYSGTNTHEAGVDEPDLVKTDGKRIITVQGGMLRVVDAASRAQVGRLDVRPPAATDTGYVPDTYHMTEMLLAGDKVLLIGTQYQDYAAGRRPDVATVIPQLTLVDIAGSPRVLARFGMKGGLVDARQVGSTVRVVMRSTPEIDLPTTTGTPDAQTAAIVNAINKADLADWLPSYTVDDGKTVRSGRVDCSAVAHPAEYSAASMLTVLTFDLGRGTLGDGDPVTIAADGETVYSNGPSLYVANDQRWRAVPESSRATPPAQRTEFYKFDTSKPGKPAFVGGGAVDGWLLNQYSMSEWNGHLRVATTTGFQGRATAQGESTVYALRLNGKSLDVVGKVGGLGKGERIYSVRFVGGTGYVVTFRQTDPLYTVDLRDPAKPVVTGELKITGYSAYLHPAGDGRLLGIGQEASTEGRVQGTQVSLFDVSDPTKPDRLAQYHVKGAHSEAEFDPHAFLYWAPTGLLVVPLTDVKSGTGEYGIGALVLRVTDGGITEVGFVQHPREGNSYASAIRRSLIIDGTLWTVSSRGLLASDPGNATQRAWVPFN
jgi:uncharacterized secreted protein with C-terminal beta-propeller domain